MSSNPANSSNSRSVDMRKVTVLLVDLDETVYPSSSAVWPLVRERLDIYLRDRLGFDPLIIPELRERLFNTYGTTLRGLQVEYSVDTDDYLAYVHNLPLRDYIQPDPQLRSILLELPQPRWIFTNADAEHAYRVLDILGVSDCFVGVIDVRSVHPAGKPAPEAMWKALERAGSPDPNACVLLDDSPANIAGAQQLGLTTVLVGNGTHPHTASYQVTNLVDLPVAHPEFWRGLVGR